MNANQFPNTFVLTKIQADSGQPLESILNRKELERQSGGAFWWGIGEPKANTIGPLLARNPRPLLLFIKMRSPPHPRDSRPDGVLLWEAYETVTGSMPLPPHSLVISRAHDRKGRSKKRYDALVCENPMGILHSGGSMLDIGLLRNFGNGGNSIGSSQITALVERSARNKKGLSYRIMARATLAAPYAVRLAAPRILSARDRRLLDEVSLDGKTAEDYKAVATQLRRVG